MWLFFSINLMILTIDTCNNANFKNKNNEDNLTKKLQKMTNQIAIIITRWNNDFDDSVIHL